MAGEYVRTDKPAIAQVVTHELLVLAQEAVEEAAAAAAPVKGLGRVQMQLLVWLLRDSLRWPRAPEAKDTWTAAKRLQKQVAKVRGLLADASSEGVEQPASSSGLSPKQMVLFDIYHNFHEADADDASPSTPAPAQ